ncbi:MAG: inorganic diphosphatase [Candidatus Bipolaricaulota bacterium]|nr:inorganic diphosphatase [Candidatus Bipolaricaulota bacterium]
MTDKWRDLETGPDAPRIIHAVIENPKRNENKYEYDVDIGELVLDRVLHTAVHYPGDYGFVPRTYDEDGDPADVLVLVTNPTFPGCIMKVRPIGIMGMLDTGKRDDKILAVPLNDPRYQGYKDIDDVPDHILDEISHMFQVYKELEGDKEVETLGWSGREEAKRSIIHAQQLYEEMFLD